MRSPESPEDARALIRWAEKRAAAARATLKALAPDRFSSDWRLRKAESEARSKATTDAISFDGIAQRYRDILAAMESTPDKR